jgi:hypothetical protein
MIFDRFKPKSDPNPVTGLTDGIEPKIAEFVKLWGDLQRGQREFISDSMLEEPLKLLTDADVELFTKSIEDELARVEQFLKGERNARVAQMDAEITRLNREIEAQKAMNQAQADEIIRRGDRLFELRELADQIVPGMMKDGMRENEIIRETVRVKMGDAAVTDKTADQIEARFEILAQNIPARQDPFQRAMMDREAPMDAKALADKAWQEMVDDMTSSHRKSHETRH